MVKKKNLWCIVLIPFLVWACDKAVVQGFRSFEKPAHFPETQYKFTTNPVTEEGFALGKKLFYDPRLSRNNTISCGSCHIQSAGFTHHGHDVSHGIDDRLGSRNSPPIMNLAWNKSFMWDGGIFDLDLFPFSPITNPVEMDETVPNVIAKLKAHPEYPALFRNAFGTEEITSTRMMKALSQFMVMMVSKDAKYDRVMNGQEEFSEEEKQGYVLFQSNCASCHKEPLFTDFSFRDNGIGAGPNNDEGRMLISLQDSDRYTFKVPSLRNLSYSKPYMHDGRMLTLEAVLDHYANRVRSTQNLDPLLMKNGNPGLGLSQEEQRKIILFLKTLDDPSFITNPMFSE